MHNSVKVFTEAFSDIARCLPPTPISCTDSEDNPSTSSAGYVASSILLLVADIDQAYTLRHAIDLHVHESCMRVAVRVLHSCALITTDIIHVTGAYSMPKV